MAIPPTKRIRPPAGSRRMSARHHKHEAGTLPTREAVLAALANERGLTGKRDLARHFGVRGDARKPFNALLRQLEDDGLIARTRKTLRRAAELPPVAVLDIPADADPEDLIAYPATWDDADGERPRVRVETGRGARVAPGPGDRILARIERGHSEIPDYAARPMKILDRPRRALIGIVRLMDDGARLMPIDRKQKEMRIPAGDLAGANDGDLVEVETSVSGRQMLPRAKVVNIVGNPNAEKAVSLIALHHLEIPYRFPQAVIRDAEALQEANVKGREDWRDIPFVTIDPATAKDHDDAVFAEHDTDPSNEGGFVVRIAIADVAAYVRPGTPLDREAYLRGNSVYFPDRVVPMLPERISNDLCSLREKQNRPSLAVTLVIGKDGRKRRHSFHRVTMRSAAKLSYQQAQAAVDGSPDDITGPLLAPVLHPLWAAYDAMARARDERGPLDLNLPERRIILDDSGMVQRIDVPERLTAHRLIEEMMIAANVAAAETLEQHHTPLIYRVHDSPGPEKLQGLRDFLQTLNLSFSKSDAVRPSHFNQTLSQARKAGNIEQVSEIVLRTQAQAVYAPDNYGHFGLNLDRYAHFTSPIRRFADLIVHRALIRALNLGEGGLSASEETLLTGISQHISGTERRAMVAERETQDRLLAQFLSGQIGARFEARISGVTRSGLFAKLTETGADGFVPASTLGTDYFRFVEAQQALIGDRTGERFRIGDAVTVRLLEAAPMAGALRFEVLSEGERVKPPGGRRGSSSFLSRRPPPKRGKKAKHR